MNDFIYILQDLMIPAIVIAVSMFLLSRLPKFHKLQNLLRTNNTLILFLISWTILGFFTKEDFTERCGCLTFSRELFSIDYIFFSSISLSIFTLSFFVRSKKTLLILLSIELIYWLYKLLFIKSGYVGGLGISVFGYYDFIGLTARFLLINNLLNYKLNRTYIPLLSGLLITIKLLVFPCQETFVYNDLIKPKYEQRLFEKLNGKWEGELLYAKDTTIYKQHIRTEFNNLLLQSDTMTLIDSTITKTVTGVHFYFNDSSMVIYEKVPKYAVKYKVEFTKPEYNYLSYLPSAYSKLYLFNSDSIGLNRLSLEIEKLTETEMIINIYEFKVKLRKNCR